MRWPPISVLYTVLGESGAAAESAHGVEAFVVVTSLMLSLVRAAVAKRIATFFAARVTRRG